MARLLLLLSPAGIGFGVWLIYEAGSTLPLWQVLAVSAAWWSIIVGIEVQAGRQANARHPR